ncbi:MAG: S9 family peptidase [Alphaproteobacteria bacterium]
MSKPSAAPRAAKIPSTDTRHGITRTDDYAWMRANNWQGVMRDPDSLPGEIRAHLEAENEHCAQILDATKPLQEVLVGEMKGRIKQDDTTPPARDGEFAYFVRYRLGGQHPIYCRIDAQEIGPETILLDGDALAKGQDYFQISAATHCPNHRYIAYGYDDNGSQYYTLKFRDIAKGADLADTLPDVSTGGVWAADGDTVFYSRLDENHRPSKILCHQLGANPDTDKVVYEEPDAGFFCDVGATQSRAFIVIDSHDHQTSEVRLLPANDISASPTLVCPRETGVEMQVEHWRDSLIILTNADGAEDFKICQAPFENPGRRQWHDLVAHRPGRLILSIAVFCNHLVRLERKDGLPRIIIHHFESGQEHAIAFDEDAYSLGFSAGYEFDTDLLRFSYSSMTTPSQIYDYNMATRTRTLRKRQEVPSGHDAKNYVTRRIAATASDGQQVPISLLYHKDTPLDGTAPCLLYGYGSYGLTVPASFSTNRLSLVDRGFVFAIAHIRGGKDRGFRWYRDGRRAKKTNTFNDFIAVAKHLAEKKIANPQSIVAHGGSAGGLLMGVVANWAPELFAAVLAQVPFVDVLNTMLDDTLPLTPPEWPEWGNPIKSLADYKTIAGYSPYDNIAAQNYPDILVLAGLTDPRVTYWEPAKWVAKLRDRMTNDATIAFKINMSAGHSGAAGRFDQLEEIALLYAFALKAVGFDAAPLAGVPSQVQNEAL